MAKEDPAKRFVQDTAEHKMTVLKDDGLYRHLRFQKPGSWYFGFDLVTWPGFLAMTGDMGEFLFSRVPDMIEFFSGRTGDPNFYYWTQKLLAPRPEHVREFRPEKFRQAVLDILGDRWENDRKLREDVECCVLAFEDDGEHEAIRNAIEFRHKGDNPFAHIYEHNLKELEFGYQWALYAIAWGVDVYVASKKEVAA